MSANNSSKANKDAALHSLLAGGSQKEAAEAAGVNRRTLHRWLKDEKFAAQLENLRDQRSARVSNKIADAQETAVDTLKSISSDPDQRGADRIKASQLLLEPILAFGSSVPRTEFIASMQDVTEE